MSVDLSYVLRTEFNRSKKEYEKAVERGDLRQASNSAIKCARILKQLADSLPRQSASYLGSANKWDAQAKSIVNGSTKKNSRKGI